MGELEGADERITLERAAEIAGLSRETLRRAARMGHLRAVESADGWYTTRRWLHACLCARRRRSHWAAAPPSTYVAPDGEEPIG